MDCHWGGGGGVSTESAAAIAVRARAVYAAAYERGLMPERAYKLNTALSRLACGTMNRNAFDVGTRAALDAIAAIGHILTLHRGVYAMTPQGRAAVMDMLLAAADNYPVDDGVTD